MKTINGDDIQKMVGHWLETPVNGYLGSTYGSSVKELLQRAHSDPESTDAFLRKMRRDVEILSVLPSDAVAVYGTVEGTDKLRLSVEVAGQSHELNDDEVR